MDEPQERVKKFCKDYDLKSPPEHRVLDLTSEVGEIAKEVLKMTDYGRKPMEYREEIKGELGDAFFCLLILSNQFGVDLEESLDNVLEKYEERMEKKGTAGSGN